MFPPRRSRILSLVLLWMLAWHAPEAHAQEEALLLGLRYQESISRVPPYYAGRADSLSRPAYHTILVVKRGDRLSLQGNADGLIVPRGNGFWRVGTKRSVYNDWVEDFIWSAPFGQAPRLPGVQAYNGEHCRGNRVQKILYVGDSYVTVEQFSAGYCEGAAHPWIFNNLAFVPIDSTAHMGLFISDVLGAAGEETFFDAAAAFRESITDVERRARYAETPDPANWGLVRREGRWTLMGRLDAASEVTQGAYADFVLPSSPPASLAGHNEVYPTWRQIRQFAPDAVDAVTAPSREFIVIVHRGLLTVHPLAGGAIGPSEVTLHIRQGTRPVMVRWASGTRARRWIDQIERTTTPGSTASRLRP